MNDNVYQQIIKGIEIELEDNFDRVFRKLSRDVIKKVGKIIKKSIKEHATYYLLTNQNGSIYHEFGITDIKKRIDAIIKLIIDELKFEYVLPRGRRTTFTFTISLLNLDFEKLLQSPEAEFYTEKQDTLEWLRWVLLQGGEQVVVGFRYKRANSKNSRTGFGIMVPGSMWEVPLSGSAENNWFTQSIERIDDEVTEIINKAISDAFN